MNKKQNILYTLLNLIKSLIVSFFGFIFSIFKPNSKKKEHLVKEEKKINLKKEKDNEKKVVPMDFSSYHNEEPETRINTHETTSFFVSTDELKQLIAIIFYEELEIKDREFTEDEKDYIKELQEKMIPNIHVEIKAHRIWNQETLKTEIKKDLKTNLEEKIKEEQKLESTDKKVVVIPILLDRPPKKFNSLKKELITLFPDLNKENDFKFPTLSGASVPEKKEPTPFLNEENTKMETLKQEVNNSAKEAKSINMDTPILDEVPTNKTTFTNKVDTTYTNNASPFNTFEEKTNRAPNPIENIEFLDITPRDDLEKDLASKLENTLENTIIKEKENKEATLEKEEQQQVPLEEQPKEKEQAKEEEHEEKRYDSINIPSFDKELKQVELEQKEELSKENLEDKDYFKIENKINYLLEKIAQLKLKNLSPEDEKILLLKEQQLFRLKDSLQIEKQKDIEQEESLLNETIMTTDLNSLEAELQKLHLDHQIDLNEYLLKNIEDLEFMTKEKAKRIETELLKRKLKKATNALEISSLLSLPFLRNKYFLYLTMGLMANRHLKFFDSILKRKTIDYEPEELAHIKKGSHALEDAVNVNEQNIEYVNYLEKMAFLKHPELSYDNEYLLYLNELKISLNKNQERMLKKQAMINKYHLKNQKNIRKLKRRPL